MLVCSLLINLKKRLDQEVTAREATRRYIIMAKCKAFGSFLHDQFSFAQVAKEKNRQKLSNIFSQQLVNLVTPARHGSN